MGLAAGPICLPFSLCLVSGCCAWNLGGRLATLAVIVDRYTVTPIFRRDRRYVTANTQDSEEPAVSLLFCRIFTARCAIVQSAALRLHVVRLSVCDVGGSGPHRLEILKTNCTDN